VSHQSGGSPVKISRIYFESSAAQNLAVRSNGAFDVTVGPVIRLWRRAAVNVRYQADRIVSALDATVPLAESGYETANGTACKTWNAAGCGASPRFRGG
jgi:thiamine biosynthesis lipoprotein ApbE